MSGLPITVLVIPADGHARVDELVLDLEAAQKLVDGFVEQARLGHGAHLLLNEEGHLAGLPSNRLATRLANLLGWQYTAPFAGTVLFVGQGEDDWSSVPDHVVRVAGHAGFLPGGES